MLSRYYACLPVHVLAAAGLQRLQPSRSLAQARPRSDRLAVKQIMMCIMPTAVSVCRRSAQPTLLSREPRKKPGKQIVKPLKPSSVIRVVPTVTAFHATVRLLRCAWRCAGRACCKIMPCGRCNRAMWAQSQQRDVPIGAVLQ